MEQERQKGRVKFYNSFKHYGFIFAQDNGPDVYFNQSDIERELGDFSEIKPQSPCEFFIELGERGRKANRLIIKQGN